MAESLQYKREKEQNQCVGERISSPHSARARGKKIQVSAQVGEFLSVPNLMHVSAIEARAGQPWRVRTEVEDGSVLIEIEPPMVLSVSKSINEPRYVTMMNILDAENKEMDVWSAENLCVTEACVGLADSPTQMAGLFKPEGGKQAEFLPGDAETQAAALADRLHRLGFC